MATKVTALLVVNNEGASALRAFAAIEAQSRKPDRVIIVDSSQDKLPMPLAAIEVPPKTKLGAIVEKGLENLEANSEHWLWLVHDDSEPKQNALAELISAIGNSDTIVQVGPMQLSAKRPREIAQLGITLSKYGELINPIKGQRDQAQHDSIRDVLAVGTSSMLVRTDAYEQVGGINDKVAALAADIDLSIRFRRHGYRVVTAPRAKVTHEGLTISGHRGRNWLGGNVKTALRKATIQLRLTHDPLLAAFLYWLALPLVTFYRIFWRVAQKRPSYMWSELRAGLWGSLTLFKRIASRRNVGKLPSRILTPLRASWADVSRHNRQALETEESAQSLAAFERGDHEISVADQSKNFTRSNGWVIAFLMVLLSWQQLPIMSAVTGASALPVSQDWFSLVARAGASWQPIGQGFVGPSDPFNWVLLSITAMTFWAPNLSLVFLLWLARSLAFASAWRALSLLTAKAWQRNLGAAVYALLPAFNASINAGEYPAVVATILTPWLVFAIARAAGLGRSGSARSDARTWSWIGLAGLLLAGIGAAAPELVILALLGLGLVAFTKIRRLGYLFWIPLPLAAIYLPFAGYQIFSLGNPLALFAEPTISSGKLSVANGLEISLAAWTSWGLLAIVLMAVLALLVRRWVVSLAIAAFAMVAYLLALFVDSLQFPVGIVNSGHSLAAAVGLSVTALAIHFSSALRAKAAAALAALFLTVAIAPLAWLSLTSNNQTVPSDGSVAPLLLQKQAELGTDLQQLVISQEKESYKVLWLPISGVHLEDSNLAYRFAGIDSTSNANSRELSKVVGDLVSANGAADGTVLTNNKIGYVLVPKGSNNAGIVAALESSPLLEGAGLTPFGDLWRVLGISASDAPRTNHTPWSITKAIQLATLLGFALLAMPSRGKTKQASDSQIFIDQSESELDV